MDLSIIIVNYKTKELTTACVQSILKSGIKSLRYEIIVVDNGSGDGSLEYLHNKFGKTITLLDNKVNAGFSKGNNRGIKSAKGNFLLLLNSDTEVTKGSIETLVSFAKAAPGAGVVGAKLLNTDGTIQDSVFHAPTLKNTILSAWLGRNDLSAKYTPKTANPIEVDAVVGAVFLITPGARAKAGLLNEKYFMYYEDLDYCREVRRLGLKVYFVPDAKIYHHHGASGKALADGNNQWRRLIPSSKLYHGVAMHYLITFVLWSSQKVSHILGK